MCAQDMQFGIYDPLFSDVGSCVEHATIVIDEAVGSCVEHATMVIDEAVASGTRRYRAPLLKTE